MERGIPATQLVKETGLSRSYLAYLESGRFTEIGLEKFTRLIQAMDLSADQVLGQAGYLTTAPREAANVKETLRARYKLSPARLQQALEFLDFLSRREAKSRSQRAK